MKKDLVLREDVEDARIAPARHDGDRERPIVPIVGVAVAAAGDEVVPPARLDAILDVDVGDLFDIDDVDIVHHAIAEERLELQRGAAGQAASRAANHVSRVTVRGDAGDGLRIRWRPRQDFPQWIRVEVGPARRHHEGRRPQLAIDAKAAAESVPLVASGRRPAET